MAPKVDLGAYIYFMAPKITIFWLLAIEDWYTFPYLFGVGPSMSRVWIFSNIYYIEPCNTCPELHLISTSNNFDPPGWMSYGALICPQVWLDPNLSHCIIEHYCGNMINTTAASVIFLLWCSIGWCVHS